MQIRVFACDGCGTNIDRHPMAHGWYVIEKKQGFDGQEWHVCSVPCLRKVTDNIVQGAESNGASE
jgi:hypothetical protein